MKTTVKVKSKGPGLRNILYALTTERIGKKVVVGVIGKKALQKHPNSSHTTAELAVIHEYNERTPRPFISTSFNAVKGAVLPKMSVLLKQAIREEKTKSELLKDVGETTSKEMRDYLTYGPPIPPELQENTIKAKRKAGYVDPSRPLMAEGYLIDAISYKVLP